MSSTFTDELDRAEAALFALAFAVPDSILLKPERRPFPRRQD